MSLTENQLFGISVGSDLKAIKLLLKISESVDLVCTDEDLRRNILQILQVLIGWLFPFISIYIVRMGMTIQPMKM